jgi:hypothetical protein
MISNSTCTFELAVETNDEALPAGVGLSAADRRPRYCLMSAIEDGVLEVLRMRPDSRSASSARHCEMLAMEVGSNAGSASRQWRGWVLQYLIVRRTDSFVLILWF